LKNPVFPHRKLTFYNSAELHAEIFRAGGADADAEQSAGARQLSVDMAFVIGDFDAVHKK
jgi:hypothetical protein